MRALDAVAVLPLLLPATTRAQGAVNRGTPPPLLWVWALVAVAVVAFLVVLLFRTGPRQRARAHAAADVRRRLQDHD